jgi:Leucine-rich repeat (LRR) protein
MLTSLQNLNLRSNRLTEVPPEVGALVSLQALDLSYNKLRVTLPVEIGLLRAVRRMDLRDNELEGLPLSFGALEALSSLDISRNYLGCVPESMKYLKSLQILNVS